MRVLHWILFRIFFIDPVPNEYNQTKVIPDDLPTHTKGSSLDGLWVTLEVTSTVLKSELSEISPLNDYCQIKAR